MYFVFYKVEILHFARMLARSEWQENYLYYKTYLSTYPSVTCTAVYSARATTPAPPVFCPT